MVEDPFVVEESEKELCTVFEYYSTDSELDYISASSDDELEVLEQDMAEAASEALQAGEGLDDAAAIHKRALRFARRRRRRKEKTERMEKKKQLTAEKHSKKKIKTVQPLQPSPPKRSSVSSQGRSRRSMDERLPKVAAVQV